MSILLLLATFSIHAENLIPKKLNHKYFLMRHAQSIPNVTHRLCTSMHCGVDPKSGLTELGKLQVPESLTKWLVQNKTEFLAAVKEKNLGIVTSPFSRTLMTMDILKTEMEKYYESETKQKAPNIEVMKDKKLIERFFGIYEGTSYSEPLWKKVTAQDEANPKKQKDQIEPLATLETRMTSVIQEFEKTEKPKKIYFIISHGDPLATLQSAFERKSLKQFGSMSRYQNAEIRLIPSI